MNLRAAPTAFLLLAVAGPALAYDLENWPTKYVTDDKLEFGVRGLYQFDAEEFSNDRLANGTARFADTQAWRREELYAYLKKDGVFELVIGFDFAPIKKNWVDNFVRVPTRYGVFRIGQFKTPVVMEEGAVASGAPVFLERALPAQMVFEDRRFGADWLHEGVPKWLLNVAVFGHQDLHGDNDGETLAARAVFNPVKDEQTVVHLGAALSREDRDDGIARVRARSEANLTPVRLVDSGNLVDTRHIDRHALEAAWRHGAWLVQAEQLGIGVARGAGRPDYSADGFYVFGSYLITGEAHPYKSGAFGNPKPKHDYGAFELALRYSAVDLDDGAVLGGSQHDWTLGANWYLGSHLKLQANYVRAYSDRRGVELDPRIVEFRAQVSF